MSVTRFIICSATYVLIPVALPAQILPRKPTMQQVIGYHQWQEQTWRKQQLPLNSVLYRYDPKNFNWQKQFASSTSPVQPMISLRQYIPLNLSDKLASTYVGVTMERQPVRWRDPNRWSNPDRQPGAAILREILINNRR